MKTIESILFIPCIFFTLLSCSNKTSKPCIEDFFKESDYELTNTKLDDYNQKVAEYYTSKKDHSKQMIKMFWRNNKVQAIMYLKNKQKDGPFESFDSSGRLYYSGFYLEDKQTGVSSYYDATGNLKRFEIFNKGEKIGSVDTISVDNQ